MRSRLAYFLREAIEDRRGAVAVMFAFVLLPLLGVAGAALDYASLTRQRSMLQSAADTSALAAARELHLAQVGSSGPVTSLAQNYARSTLAQTSPRLSNVVVNVALLNSASSLQVTINGTYQSTLFRIPVNMSAQATASAAGFPICALALDTTSAQAIYLEANAKVTAEFCAVQSNSSHAQGLTGAGNSMLTAASICSAGGAAGEKVNFNPAPLTDCPVVADPLVSRPTPKIGACTYTNEVVTGGTVALMPGTYCGGLHVTGGANVTLTSGVHIMKDGPLIVDDNSSFTTQNAGIFLKGAASTFLFDATTSINMTAPTTGLMAGMLIFDDPAAPSGRSHQILSNNAPLLLGTIYTPKGILVINTNNTIAEQSAFTIIVAYKMQLYSGPNLVLNSNYNLTNVPVPNGLNPGYPYLSQ
jgi:Flp pilus assembly protein TadG